MQLDSVVVPRPRWTINAVPGREPEDEQQEQEEQEQDEQQEQEEETPPGMDRDRNEVHK